MERISMRDSGTFIVRPNTSGLPSGNFGGYIDQESSLSLDYALPFPHVRATYQVARCVMRIERIDHPEVFAAGDPCNMKDIDVTELVTAGIISYDQHVVPDALLRGTV
jgi:hypothetical protein